MTNEQSEALRLADALELDPMPLGWYIEAAAELRRLHEVNAELVKALSWIHPFECDKLHHEKKHRHSYAESCPVKEWLNGVLAKTQGCNNE